jgi:NTP pyrophosphatase (non-canonical NTP hydrolase)
MMPYFDLDDLEDLVIHYQDMAKLIQKQLGDEMGDEVRALADKVCKRVKEEKYGLS